jgi:hypothetical protein
MNSQQGMVLQLGGWSPLPNLQVEGPPPAKNSYYTKHQDVTTGYTEPWTHSLE